MCPDRQRITPQRRYLLIDHLKVTDEATQSACDQDLQQELLFALKRFHFEPTFLHKMPLESNFRLCDYCRSLRDSSFALCHLTRHSSLDVYLLLGLVTGLDIPSLLIVRKERDDSTLKPFEIPSILKGLDLFEYEHYNEISERLANEVEGFLNSKKYLPIAGRILPLPEAWLWGEKEKQEDQTQREPSETAQAEAHAALQQRLLEVKSISDAQEQQYALTQLSQELADQVDVAGLRELLLLARSLVDSTQQAEALVIVVEAFARVNDIEGIRRVVEVVLGEEVDEVRDPVLEAVVRAYERLGEHEKASEVASVQESNLHSVSSESDGILLNEKSEGAHPPKLERKHIFISYSHKDQRWLDRLLTVLSPLAGREMIITWPDMQLDINWREEMLKAVAFAKVVVLLVTPNFIASEFLTHNLLPPILNAADHDGLTILWIAVSSSSYNTTPVAEYQSVNDPLHPLDKLKSTEQYMELVRISENIKQAAGIQYSSSGSELIPSMQNIRQAEYEQLYEQIKDWVGEIRLGILTRKDLVRGWLLEFGEAERVEGIMPPGEEVPTEHYRVGQRLRVYVYDVRRIPGRMLQIMVSRTHRDLVRRLFESEVPEIYEGTVEIKAIAREPGSRSKVAVVARQVGLDPIGSCVGVRGSRINNIVHELNEEKIDIIQWSPDPATFVAHSLSPMIPLSVELRESDHTALVTVPERQLSLAIGKNGQNARLAAKLTGWRVDIKK